MFSHVPLMPHSVCWRGDPELIWAMVVANAITALSYVVICCTLFYLVRYTRRVFARDWAYFAIGFALFIVACGSTHLMEVVTTWIPFFWIDALTNIVTAVLSAWVAAALIRRVRSVGDGINDYAARLANSVQEQHQMRESLMAAQKLEEWSRMSAMVAHEVANPLEAIQNLLYLIRHEETASPEVVRWASSAADEAERVITISRSTLDFFRRGSVPERVDLFVAAESVRVLLQSSLNRHRLNLELLSTGDTSVEALPGEPRQVLLNLMRNACEATLDTDRKVTVTLHGKEDGVEVFIADQGTGIPPTVLAQLFSFGVTTKGTQGNGMGLWAVLQIMQRHGGSVEVAETSSAGTVFRLWWPRTFTAVPTAPHA
jgi:signal transduction histidine kinase